MNIGSMSINNRVSEQPSESCSVIDEHDCIEVKEVNPDSEDSGESKNSDKENSNMRNNRDAK